MQRIPGIHNLLPEIFQEQIEELRAIDIDLSSGLDLALAQSVIINTLGGDFWAKECTTFGQKQKFGEQLMLLKPGFFGEYIAGHLR